MSEVKIIGDAVKNMPWQEGPAEFSGAPVWRYSENPIIGRNPVKEVARIFNSAVMPYGDEFIGVFRGEQTNGIPYIYLGRSKDAIHWNFDENKIQFVDEEGKPFMPVYAYDPRLVKVEDTVSSNLSSIQFISFFLILDTNTSNFVEVFSVIISFNSVDKTDNAFIFE